MAESKLIVPNQPLNLDQIMQEAVKRWFRPSEVCEILHNYKKFYLTPDPPVQPPAGSLFLFDRKALRYFRKDGHRWRKKRDGKTIKEAHEKLKIGSVDVLHCYYAHGEDNENFQRRSYWMLDERLENIVLVHYREVTEGYRLGVSRLLNTSPEPQLGNSQTFFEQTHSPDTAIQMSYASRRDSFDWNEQIVSSGFHDGESGEDLGTLSLVQSMRHSASQGTSFHADKSTGDPGANSNHGSVTWADVCGSSRNINIPLKKRFFFEQPNAADFLSHKLIDARLDADTISSGLILNSREVVQLESCYESQEIVPSTANIGSIAEVGGLSNAGAGELKKLDSFGRWMDKEIGKDCDNSLMAPDSGKYWNTLDTENDDKGVSRLSRHIQLDTDSLGPSLSQDQLFSICDFAPDWAYSGVETKILVLGTFLGDKKHSSSYKWCCMFGQIEVSAEVLSENVLRCQVPFHAPGRVPFYVTCSNRLACSEVREFEYRENSSGDAYSMAVKEAPQEELRLLIRLVKLLTLGLERNFLDCSVVGCDKCKLKNDICSLKSGNDNSLERIEEAVMVLGGNFKDTLIQNLLKDKLYEWLVCKAHEVGKRLHILGEEGQGVIHMAAALGYEWAMGPIVAAGVSPNFRDTRGKTALHWASYYGREETVIALLRLGAAAGAVDDPTTASSGGQTAADLASIRGHKGISGYLAEADLTSHLSSLTVNENVMDCAAASIAAQKALESAMQSVISSDKEPHEEVSLEGSLAAVRKSAHAASLIQAAFRTRSFRSRQLTKGCKDTSDVPLDLIALGSLNKVQKMGHFEDYLHSSAIKIQQKYRGWHGRKEFLKIRSRIVKIQAHVRGHQVRKHYKKIVWSVSIVEKAILRWRRRKPGLRGFQIKSPASEAEKSDEYDFLRIGRKQKVVGVEKALARVQSMVRHTEARDQYMRLVTHFKNFKTSDEKNSASQQAQSGENEKIEDAPDP